MPAHVEAYALLQGVPTNALHAQGYVSIGCEPCTRAVLPNQHEREGRWWWEVSYRRLTPFVEPAVPAWPLPACKPQEQRAVPALPECTFELPECTFKDFGGSSAGLPPMNAHRSVQTDCFQATMFRQLGLGVRPVQAKHSLLYAALQDATGKECGLHSGNVVASAAQQAKEEAADLWPTGPVEALSMDQLELLVDGQRDKDTVVVLYAPWCQYSQVGLGFSYDMPSCLKQVAAWVGAPQWFCMPLGASICW